MRTKLWSKVSLAQVLVMLLVLGNAHASSALKDMSFASLPGGRFEVRVDFDSLPPAPAGYEIEKPARIVFDFAGVQNQLSTKKFPLPFENAQSAVVLSGGDRTRLILNMTSLEQYTTRTEGNSFFVEVGSGQIAGPLTKTADIGDKLSSSKPEQLGSAITNVDFRRGENGEGKILVTLSDPSAKINVEQSKGEINLNFLNTMLPQSLRRRLDVTDFATPVLSVASSFDGKDTMISVKPQGDYDYLAYQADNIYVVSIKHLTEQEQQEKKSKFAYVGEKLSLNFQDIAVRSVLQIIADFTELNLVASDTVQGTITLRLDSVPWDQALDLVLKTKGLDKRQVGNVLMVAPAAEIAEQERRQLENKKQLEELAPLRTEHLKIIFADAKKVFEIFSGSGDSSAASGGGSGDKGKSSILSARGSAIVDERTNSIIITETDEKIAEFRALIKQIDVPVRQVSIETRIVRASTTFSKDLGVNWNLSGAGNVAINGNNGTITSDTAGLAATSTTGAAPSKFKVGILDSASGASLSLELSALEDSGNAEVVSQPKVVTQDKTEAMISSGEQIPYISTTGTGSSATSTTTFKDALLKLKVTPYISQDDHIKMKVAINKDARGKETLNAGPAIDTTQLLTEVMVANGETAVVGGIFEETIGKDVSKVPFLGDIPFIGGLFTHSVDNRTKIELIIFLTPRIVSDPLAKN